jgi:maltose O-acetyltransferase
LIGDNTYIGSRSAINVEAHSCVSIGSGCQISHNVRIYTKTAIADQDFSVKPVQTRQGDVSIGDYCWVGVNVFIGPGVRVGKNCVIGANSVVTRDIPDFEIWGGVPAKFIRRKKCELFDYRS